MIHIDIKMPMSCEECPFRSETYHYCPIVPNIPSWQEEIADKCRDKRSEHCPLNEV